MKNTDPRIDSYIAKAAGFGKPILRRLRKLVHAACPDTEETLKWGSPTFLYRGKIMAGMAAFKAHCIFGFWHQGMEAVLGADGGKADTAMGSLGRITSLDDLPSNKKMLRYIEWITEARRDETRQKRLATTLGWLAEGKTRNWKYENC